MESHFVARSTLTTSECILGYVQRMGIEARLSLCPAAQTVGFAYGVVCVAVRISRTVENESLLRCAAAR